MNEHLHIGIEDASSRRKELLNINIGVIKTLTKLEKIKGIRERKLSQMSRLRILTKKLSNTITEFEKSLPSDKEPAFLSKAQSKQKTSVGESKKKHGKIMEKDASIERLQGELKALKDKISAL